MPGARLRAGAATGTFVADGRPAALLRPRSRPRLPMAKAIPLHEAWSRVAAVPLPRLSVERVPLAEAHGRFLAEPVATDGPWPATDRSAMDGFAVAAAPAGLPAGTTLPVVGQSLAGAPFPGALAAGLAIRIMTGAVVPEGADAVVPVEQTSGFQPGGAGGERVELRAPVRAGQHVRKRGSEAAPGQQVLAPGRCLRSAEIGALAVLGRAQVPVYRRLRVAIVATGDEVVPVDSAPLPHQVRESNSWALAAQVHELGAEPLRLGIAPDEAVALRARLARGLAEADVLLTIGGISAGTHDLVHGELRALGVREIFHGIELKPGKPTFFGVGPAGDRFVFGLPGNPASAFTVFDLMVRPLLLRWVGADPGQGAARLPASGAGWSPNARLQALPARLVAGEGGRLSAALAAPSPSGDPFSLLGGDVYVLVAPQQTPGPGIELQIAGSTRGAALP